MKKLTISLVTYNSERYLPYFCASLSAQTFTDWDLIVVDNNSFDNSVALIQEHLPQAKIVRQKQNLGFSRAHNLVIRWSKTPYILFINPDIILEPDCIEKLMDGIESNSAVATVGAKLLYWDFNTQEKTTIIDSFGLTLHKNYKITESYSGKKNFTLPSKFVFGISGALALMRREALEKVKATMQKNGNAAYDEYFDEDFFAYKEDADLAWRLILAGFRNELVPGARAYHARQISAQAQTRHARKKRGAINRYSYRNHLLMVYKNHFWSLTLTNFLPIIAFEVAKFFYLAALDGSSVQGSIEFLRLLPKFRAKRAAVVHQRTLTAQEFKQWYL